jgi:hypothetical protein
MRRFRDAVTPDMFELLPPPAATAAGSLACRPEIAHAMSDALKGLDRFDVAAKMSKLLDREISKFMLDAYTAESREDHIPPLDTAIAFDLATGTQTLAMLVARKIGARLLIGEEALHAELGKLDRIIDEAQKKRKQIKTVMGERE